MWKTIIKHFLFFFAITSSLFCFAQGNILALKNANKYLYNNTDSSLFFCNIALNKIDGSKHSLPQSKALTLLAINTTILGDSPLALQKIYRAKQYIKNKNASAHQVNINIQIGEIYYNWSVYDSALIYFKEANKLANAINSAKLKAQSLLYIGKYYHSLGSYSKSLNHYEEAQKLAAINNDTLLLITIQNKIGKHYETLGSYTKAISQYIKSESMLHAIQNKMEAASTFNHLGNIYHLLGDIKLAAKFHNKALELRQHLKYKEGIAKSLNNLGEVFIDNLDYDQALMYFNKSYNLCTEINYTKGRIKALNNLGIINNKKNNQSKAIRNFDKALELSNNIDYDKGKLNALFNLASLKLNTNNALASQYIICGIQISEKKNIISKLAAFYHLQSINYEKKNMHNKALQAYKQFHKANNELMVNATNKKIIALETQFETSLKQKENEMLKRENEINGLKIIRKNILIYSISTISVLLIIIVASVLIRNNQKNKDNLKLTQLNDKILKQNIKLDRLNKDLNTAVNHQVKLFSIIAHELRNPLWWFRNLIQMLSNKVHTLDKTMIAKSLNSMNESATNTFHLMDNLLQWSRTQLGNIKYNPTPIPINDLIEENLRMVNYVLEYKKQQIVFEKTNNYYVYADKNMVQTIYRNLLSNAIKFTPDNGIITTSITKNKKQISIKISDTGVGIPHNTLSSLFNQSVKTINTSTDLELGTGLGLQICKEFIALSKGHFNAQSKIGEGSEFTFTLPEFISKI